MWYFIVIGILFILLLITCIKIIEQKKIIKTVGITPDPKKTFEDEDLSGIRYGTTSCRVLHRDWEAGYGTTIRNYSSKVELLETLGGNYVKVKHLEVFGEDTETKRKILNILNEEHTKLDFYLIRWVKNKYSSEITLSEKDVRSLLKGYGVVKGSETIRFDKDVNSSKVFDIITGI